jgi:hypothetical protein
MRFCDSLDDRDAETLLPVLEGTKNMGVSLRLMRYLPSMMSSGSMPPSGKAMFDTHISLFNDLAKRERCIFLTDQPTGDSSYGSPSVGGIGPQSAQVGDSIVLVSGVRLPLVLRRQPHSSKIIGSVVLDGSTMKGQIWSIEGTESDMEEFILS